MGNGNKESVFREEDVSGYVKLQHQDWNSQFVSRLMDEIRQATVRDLSPKDIQNAAL